MIRKTFISEIRQILQGALRHTYRAINFAMVQAYWSIGHRILEEEQHGSNRAGYGDALLAELAVHLTGEFGKGFEERELRRIRQFYQAFPIRDALRPELSWTHYRIVIRVEDPVARNWYMLAAADNAWSSRLLERNITTKHYERLLSPGSVILDKDHAAANQVVRDPYILEFLGLEQPAIYSESDIEAAIINNIQSFLLELGTGFSFVARQYRIKTDTRMFFIDLVFYHFILKCFVLLDLKITALTHQDIGQMDMYVRMFEAMKRRADDKPTLGIILCSEKDHSMIKYSMLEESKQLFASEYSLVLPSEAVLTEQLGRAAEMYRKAKIL
ncbi:PDDEXK nuclease domain-containing protein [Chitinophaga horti]|uniref:PDDEXK nuclease domain-containing protein n=1 Tax=Chitinophaga horti TaxID=2920382 RepID=A0ABY6J783_9BACT|nr:PDDEXK nuclease domain-containing protein [Chitinophaga horti]UYQ95503.1 PDDEXK nuclease domain-containing protein [Chitinophaga horti]